ncbi:MAG TPA: universal stress protein [Gemmatimonadaceae bacterium]
MSSTTSAPRPATQARGHAHTGPVFVAVGENGRHVVRTALTLAPAYGDHVHVFSAIEPLPVEFLSSEPILIPPSFEEGRRQTREEHLRACVDEVVGSGGNWEVEVEHGDPAASICRRARELDASLIVMGIGRHHPIDRIVGAETTLRVIRHASCPVFAVVGELTQRPTEVVVATDFSPPCALAIEAVLPLLGEHATLHLVHVWEPCTSADPTLFDIDQTYERALPARMARFVSALHLPADITVRSEVHQGKAVPQLLAFAESRRAHLVLAGRHGLNPVARLFVGSVTTALVRGATCSVLVTPEPTGAEFDRLQRELSGTSSRQTPEEWARVLTGFAKRNEGRRTRLEVDDPSIGAQIQETGYALMGATYDRRDDRVELMLGMPRASTPHLTRTITGVDFLSLLADATGGDLGLCIKHGKGQTVLMLAPET